MSPYQGYQTQPSEFLALTGYTHEEFEALLPAFRQRYYQRMATHRLDGGERGKRPYRDYQNSPLPTIEDKLFFILTYLKTNNLQAVQGALFQMSQPKANRWIHCLHPLLNQALGDLGELPARQMTALTFDKSKDTLFFHDGTERPILRPSDPLEQQRYYSGKKTAYAQKQCADQSAV
jgi:Helix-turn-helix of DDE superfamily endonuclease